MIISGFVFLNRQIKAMYRFMNAFQLPFPYPVSPQISEFSQLLKTISYFSTKLTAMKDLPLHWKILIGMFVGIVFGIVASMLDARQLVIDWIKPFGTIFINLLKLIAIPLIIASLIKGVSDLKDISKLSRMGGRTVLIYIFTKSAGGICYRSFGKNCSGRGTER
jgi:hypothetical protein